MTQPTDTAYIWHIAALAVAIHMQDIKGQPFKELTISHLDTLGVNTKDFRKRHSTLMRQGYDWRMARDVATYEGLQVIGLLPSSV